MSAPFYDLRSALSRRHQPRGRKASEEMGVDSRCEKDQVGGGVKHGERVAAIES